MSVANSTSSCGLPSILGFRFFSTKSASSSTHICAFGLIPLMEYDVVFPLIFVKSLILGIIEDGSWFTTHSVAFFRDWFVRWRICSSVLSLPYACVKRNCSSSATSEENVVASMGVVCTSSRILRWTFSVTFSSNLEKNSAAVLTEPAIRAILLLSCSP